MSSNTQQYQQTEQQTPQTENRLGSTIVIFAVMMALFLASVYSLSFLTLGNPWPMAVCLAPVRRFVLDSADDPRPLGLGRRKLSCQPHA